MATNHSNGQLTAQVKIDPNAKSGFDLSHHNYGTGKIGRIIPTRAMKVHPGDTINTDSKVAVQFEPLAVPILANMDLKQEHFYVPYNTVWKDWDEFISNGEDNDFNGTAPSVTFVKIMNVLFSRFSALFNYRFLFSDVERNGTFTNGYVKLKLDPISYNVNGYEDDDVPYINQIMQQFENFATTFKVRDIFKYIDECKLNLFDYVRANQPKDGINVSEVDTLFYITTNAGEGYKLYDQMVQEGLITSKYITNMKDWYRSYGLPADEKYPYAACIPTDKAVDFARCLYEFIKPLVGIGSNLDYLNMGRLTFEEFLFEMSAQILWSYNYDFEVISTDIYTDGLDTTYSIVQTNYQESALNFNNEPLVIFNLRANYSVWYHNYRDPILEADVMKPVNTTNITDDELITLLIPRQRCWSKDTFTTALDNPGTGNVGVPIVNNNLYVLSRQEFGADYDSACIPEGSPLSDSAPHINGNNIYQVRIGDDSYRVPTAFLSGMNWKEGDNVGNGVSGFSLFQLDAAQRAQKWLQKMLFFGNRIQDFYYLRFNVKFLDGRLRLPELLSSSSEVVSIDTVMNNTNITTEVNGQKFQTIAGDRAGYASAYDKGGYIQRFIEEHGVLLSYLTIMPRQSYAFGRNRDYSRVDMFDYAFSEFATLGMDAVYSTELASSSFAGGIMQNTQLDPAAEVFGYQGRYYDYKSQQDEEHGELLDSQDMYTFARQFHFGLGGKPRLNYEFVHCFPNLDMFVVNSKLEDYFRYDVYHQTTVDRQLPAHSIYI